MRGSLYQYVEAPDDAGDGHQVEGDAAAELPPLQRTHVQLLPLIERFYLPGRIRYQVRYFQGVITTALSY